MRKTKKLDLLSNLIGGKYQVSSLLLSCSDMIFKYLWIRWINKIELKMILYFFVFAQLLHSLSRARWYTYFIRAIFLCTQKLNFRHTYALVSLQRKEDNAEYSMNALSERARNLFVNRRKALFPLFPSIPCLKKLTRRGNTAKAKKTHIHWLHVEESYMEMLPFMWDFREKKEI